MAELKRQLGLLDSTMINVGTIIASAIFIVPSTIALQLHASAPTILVWVVGGAVSLLGALCVAELGAAMPRAGGLYVYLSEAYGPVWGYLYGWTSGVVINPASIAAIAVGFATYLGFFTPLGAAGIKAVAIASIVALTVLNCLGVKPGTVTQNALTLIKMGVLAALIVIGFVLPGGSVANFRPLWPEGSFGSLIAPFGVAMVAALWAYDGWIEITYVGGEVKDPERNLPRSIVLSTVIGIALYCLVTASFTYVLSPAKMAASSLVASDAAQVTLGRAGAGLVAVAIMIATLGSNNGIRFLTPVPSLVVQAVIAIALTFTGTYNQLFTYVIFAEFVSYAAGCGAVIRLRHGAPGLARPYRTWGYPVTPIVFIAFAAWLVGNTIAEQPRDAGIGTALILAGLPFYYWWRRVAIRPPIPASRAAPAPAPPPASYRRT